MALVSCPECSSEVSSEALKCPKCGYGLRIPKRGLFGKIFKWSFILWNVLMLVWLIAGVNAASKLKVAGEAQRAGRDLGTALGAGLIITIWVAGSVIIGLFVLFTKPRA